MIVGRALFVFYVTVTIQFTNSLVFGAEENKCPTYGDLCFPNDQNPCCGEKLQCKQSKNKRYECVCKPDYEWNDGRCQYVPDISCITNTDCERQKFSECTAYGSCRCQSNYVKTNPSTCQGLIGAACSRNYECFPHDSICLDGFCKCKCNYLSTVSDLCLPTFFELTCSAGDERCQDEEFSGCLHGKCHCHPNHVVSNMTCQPLLYENCAKNGQCAIKHSICRDNVCQCKSDYIALSNNRCLPTKLNGYCQINDDCRYLDNSKCSKYYYCTCIDNYFHFNETTCVPLIGEKCESNADCMIENSICFNGFCKCKNSYKSSFNEKCVTALHNFCETDSDCNEGTFTKCSQNNTCECEPDYFAAEKDMICLPSISGLCNIDDDCTIENSYCQYNRCQCKKFYLPVLTDGIYSCLSQLLGHPCQKDKDCEFSENFICSSDGICSCSQNFYALEDRTRCLPKIGGPCSIHQDCRVKNSFCLNGRCQCNRDCSAVSENECVLKSSAVYCDRAIECGEPWHAGCSPDHNCFCKTNSTLVNKSTCSPMLGGPCLKNHQCVVENSVCKDFHCKCQSPNFKPVANNLCVSIPN